MNVDWEKAMICAFVAMISIIIVFGCTFVVDKFICEIPQWFIATVYVMWFMIMISGCIIAMEYITKW